MTWGENKEKGFKEQPKGQEKCNSLDKESYIKNCVVRGNFKRACGSSGWDFVDFIEIYSGKKQNSNKKFYYVTKEVYHGF